MLRYCLFLAHIIESFQSDKLFLFLYDYNVRGARVVWYDFPSFGNQFYFTVFAERGLMYKYFEGIPFLCPIQNILFY